MSDLHDRIIAALDRSGEPLDMVDLAITLKEDVGDALLELQRAGRIHQNHRQRFRLTNEERGRLRNGGTSTVTLPASDPIESKAGALPVLRTEFEPKCRHCTDWEKRGTKAGLVDHDFGWCARHQEERMHYESHDCHSDLRSDDVAKLEAIADLVNAPEPTSREPDPASPCTKCVHRRTCEEWPNSQVYSEKRRDETEPEPTDAELDAIEAEDADEPSRYDVNAAESQPAPLGRGRAIDIQFSDHPHSWSGADTILNDQAATVCDLHLQLMLAEERVTELKRKLAAAIGGLRGAL